MAKGYSRTAAVTVASLHLIGLMYVVGSSEGWSVLSVVSGATQCVGNAFMYLHYDLLSVFYLSLEALKTWWRLSLQQL